MNDQTLGGAWSVVVNSFQGSHTKGFAAKIAGKITGIASIRLLRS